MNLKQTLVKADLSPFKLVAELRLRALDKLYFQKSTVHVLFFLKKKSNKKFLWVQTVCLIKTYTKKRREQKFHSSACNYEWNLERTSNSSQSTRPIGQVDECFTRGSHITPLWSLLHTLFKDKYICLQDKWTELSHSSCRTSAILKYFISTHCLNMAWAYCLFS